MITLSTAKKAKIFKALSDEKRIEILELLKDKEECACVLLEKLKLTQSGLSYHMKILCESGIVLSRQDGKWTYYQISKDGVLKVAIVLFNLAGIK